MDPGAWFLDSDPEPDTPHIRIDDALGRRNTIGHSFLECLPAYSRKEFASNDSVAYLVANIWYVMAA
jgi:hypothetical protein